MYLERDAKRLHNDQAPSEREEEGPAPPESPEPSEEEQDDPRLIDHVHFEHSAESEAFCVPCGQGNAAKPKGVKRAKDEGEIMREDVEDLCRTVLAREVKRGYWDIGVDGLASGDQLVVLEFGTLAFVVACEEGKLIRIGAEDVVAILGSCLDSDADSPSVKKVASTWISHVDSDRAVFKWEIRGPKKMEWDPSARSQLQQRAKSFFKARASGKGKKKEDEKPTRPDGLVRCISEMSLGNKR